MMSKSFHLSTKFKEKFKERIYKRGDNDYCKGISTLVGAGILNFLVGAIFSLCTLSVYEISYIKAKGGSISIDHLTFYYPIEIIFQYISAFFSGKIYDDLGLHITNLIGTTILTLGYFIMYMSSSLLMDLSSMIVGGIGTGIILYPSTTNAIEWFTQHNGIIMGIMETMISFGSFFFAFIGEIIINKEKIPSHSDDNLYDYQIGKKIKLYLIIQILALDCAFLISYGLMFEKEEEEENFLKDLENETQVIRFETVTDINEHIEQNDEHFDDNIKINEKKNEGHNDSDNKNRKEISEHLNIQKSELENKKDKKSESEGEKKEEKIKNIVNDELLEEKKDFEEKKEENKSINKKENIEKDKEKKIIEKDSANENRQDNNKYSKENNELKKNNENKNNIKEEKEEPLLIKNTKENNTKKSGQSSSDDEEDSEEKKRILKQALKSKRLLLFSAIVILQAPVANMAFSLYREIGEYYKIDLRYLQLVGSLYFIFECLSSFVFGLLCDYIQLKYLLFFINGVGTFVGFIYCLTFKNGLIFFLVQNFLSFSAGGYYPVKDCYLMKVFGKDIYIELSGYVSFLVAISVNLITPIAYFVQSELKEKGMADAANWILFISFGVMNLIGLILNIFIQETPIIFDDNEEDIEAIDVNQL